MPPWRPGSMVRGLAGPLYLLIGSVEIQHPDFMFTVPARDAPE